MADEGPTTAGSIVGKLKLDISDWLDKIQVAKAAAKDLGASDPTITVHTNTADAEASLNRVKAQTKDLADAEAKLALAQAAAALASQRADLAQMKLDEARNNGKTTDIQLAAAEIALEAATLRESAAADKALRINKDLVAAREAAAAAALSEGAAEDEEAKSASRSGDQQKSNINRTALIIGLIATLIPMIGPLAGYATGVAGAFGMMGVAGVVAVLGIKAAMASGTAVGQEYSAGLQLLKSDLSGLENNAATVMLQAFNQAISTINSNMPMLNSDITVFSRILGTSGNLALQGALNLLRALNPLFIQGGVYVEQLAEGFEKWTQGSGLQQFGNYAQQMLPLVAQDLGQLVQGVLHLVAALSPLGTIILGTLGLLGTVLNAIPTPVLLTLVTVVGLVFLGFKLWAIIPGIIDAVETAMLKLMYAADAAGGPLGLLLLAVSVIATVMLAATSATQAQTAATDSYTSAVQEDNGVVGENTAMQAANNLQKAGAFDAASKLGISQKTLTDATLGNSAAIKDVNAATDAYAEKNGLATSGVHQFGNGLKLNNSSMREARTVLDTFTNAVTLNSGGIKDQIKAYNNVALATGATTISTKAQLQAEKDLAASYGVSLSVYVAAQGQNKKTADSLAATTVQMQLQNDAAGLLSNALTILNGGSLSLMQAQTGQAAATNSLTDSFKQNGSAIAGGTKAAVANQQALQAKVQADQAEANAVAKATGSTVAGTKAYADSKAALEAALKAQGNLTPAVQAYIDKLYDIKNLKIPPTQLDVETAAALLKIAQLKAQINSINSRSIAIDLNGSESGNGRMGTYAEGGPIVGSSSPTGDKVPIMASPNEYMIGAAAASRYSGLVSAINTGTPQQVAAAAAQYTGGGGDVGFTLINKSGLSTLDDLIEVHITKNNQTQRVNISTGTQRASR